VDGICQAQATADAEYFIGTAARPFTTPERTAIHGLLLKAYRWQYIVTGAQEPRFVEALESMVTPAQMERVVKALAPIVAYTSA
jgi:hypothetical protein